MSTFWIGFCVGMIIGLFVTIMIIGLFVSVGRSDEREVERITDLAFLSAAGKTPEQMKRIADDLDRTLGVRARILRGSGRRAARG